MTTRVAAAVSAPDPDELGPAMLALDERRRRFVVAYIGDGRDATRCALAAGYEGTDGALRVQAHRLMHNPKVIEGIKEEANRRLNGTAYIAAAGLADIAADPEHRDRFRACADILDRTGFPRTTQHAVAVEHDLANVSTAELMRRIRELTRGHRPIEGEVVREEPCTSDAEAVSRNQQEALAYSGAEDAAE